MKKPKQIKSPRRFPFFDTAVALLLLLLVYAHTPGCKRRVIGLALDFLNKELKGKVEIRDINFISIRGVEFFDVRLLAAGDTVAYIPKLAVAPDLRSLFGEKIKIYNLVLDRPVLKMLRNGSDSSWNIEHIVYPSTDTAKAPGTLKLEIASFRINNARFRLADSTADMRTSQALNYSNLALEEFNLSSSVSMDLAKNEFIKKINSLSFSERNTGLRLQKFAGNVRVSPKGIRLREGKLVTDKSDISLRAGIRNFDLFGEKAPDLEKAIFRFNISSQKLNCSDIYYFAPSDLKLRGEHKVLFKGKGTLQDMKVSEIKIENGDTYIAFDCRIENMLDPALIRFTGNFDKSKTDMDFITRTLPEFKKEDLPELGNISIAKLNYNVTPKKAKAHFDVSTGAGKLKGKGDINYATQQLAYDAEVTATDIDLSKITRSPDMQSAINGTLVIKGLGTDPQHLAAELQAELSGSRFNNTDLKKGSIDIGIQPAAKIDIRNIALAFQGMSGDYDSPGLAAKGSLDLGNMQNPAYDLTLDIQAMDIRKISGNKSLPDYLTGNISIKGTGFDTDSLEIKAVTKIETAVFADKAFLPFDLSLSIDRYEDKRRIDLNSDFGNIYLDGKFTFDGILASLQNQGLYLAHFAQDKINKLLPDNSLTGDTIKTIEISKTGSFENMDFKIAADIRDLTPLSTFLDSMSLASRAKIDLHFFSGNEESSLFINSIEISDFHLNTPDMSVHMPDLKARGGIYVRLKDSVPEFSDFNLLISSDEFIRIDDLNIRKPAADLTFNGTDIYYDVSAGINENVVLSSEGQVTFEENGYRLKMDEFLVTLDQQNSWKNRDSVIIDFDGSSFNIGNFNFYRDSSENISVTGIYRQNTNSADNLRITISDFYLKQIVPFMSVAMQEKLRTLRGSIDSALVILNGPLANPLIDLELTGKNIALNNQMIGDISAGISHKDSIVRGALRIAEPRTKKELLNIDIVSLPLFLGLTDVGERLHPEKEVDIRMIVDSLPLVTIQPFVPNISQLSGRADLMLNIKGNSRRGIDYSGEMEYKDARFLVDDLNMFFRSEGKILILKDSIALDDIAVYNVSQDYPGGKAMVNGHFLLKDFDIDYFKLNISSDNFKVLSDASRKNMPTLYGDLVIATGLQDITFDGNFDEPNLKGSLDILRGDLKMPVIEETQLVVSRFEYVEKLTGESLPDDYESSRDTTLETEAKVTDNNIGRSFMDILNQRLEVRFLNPINVTMEMNSLVNVVAKVGSKDRTKTMRYEKYRYSDEAAVSGGIDILPGSKLNFLKSFDLEGTISFPTGSISNPALNITGSHRGRTRDNREFKVMVDVSGTKAKPNLYFSYEIDGDLAVGDQSKIQQDVFMLLLSGTMLNQGNSNAGQGIQDEALSIGVSEIATREVNKVLSRYGLSAHLNYDPKNVDNTKIQIGGELFKNINLNSSFSPDGSQEYSFSVSIGNVFDLENLRNFLFEASYNRSNIQVQTRNQTLWEGKIKYGRSW